METSKALQELIDLIYRLDTETDEDWFFSFSGHVDIVTIYYRKEIPHCTCCGEPKTEMIFVTSGTNFAGLPGLITKLKTFLPENKNVTKE